MSVKILTAPKFLPDNREEVEEHIRQAKRMICDVSEQLTDLASQLSYCVQVQDHLGLNEATANDIGEIRNHVIASFSALNKTGARD